MLTVRDAVLEDAERIVEIYDYYVKHTAITFEYETPSVEELQERMKKTWKRYPYLVIEKDGCVQGYAYAGDFISRAAADWACEVTIYLHKDAHKCCYKFGRWYHMIWAETLIGKHEKQPAVVTPYADCLKRK